MLRMTDDQERETGTVSWRGLGAGGDLARVLSAVASNARAHCVDAIPAEHTASTEESTILPIGES